ncbi:hypothetical protein QWY75_10125 [Pontixanthobacter aestiaquae]|uniref:hypothetical protein n=1 Tax=Pontixanthobacter aestiaquae TaxID=1509367 RepID=UPI001370582D|nr:hypothetical protein [Pontixanthobacter aestiaquae]MDN3646554.1 hypothetical protein [Pontixanthobacter aestiaquae]
MAHLEYEDKFIGFIDILGFKDMIEQSEKGEGLSVNEIQEILSELEHRANIDFIRKSGPKICPTSPRLNQGLDFEVTQISDCAIVSSEISPAGLINLINHCWGAVITLLTKGILMRGYITRGNIVHHGNLVIGTGYQEAYSKEGVVTAFKIEADEKGTPFVEVDPSVLKYVNDQEDTCVKEMFGRMVESDGTVAALYPFKRLSHSFMIGGLGMPQFDPQKEKRNNDRVRQNLKTMIARLIDAVPEENTRGRRKTRHYISALEQQLKTCDKTDEMIDKLAGPVGPQ